MKSLVAYYSHYGNTARMADTLLEVLRKKGEASITEIEYSNKHKNIFQRTFYRFFPMFVKLAPAKANLKEYDLLCLGIPVWAGRPSAPVTKYLLLIKNATGKKVLCFYVYGFQESAKRCSRYVNYLLKKKGFSSIENIFVHWDDIGNDILLNKQISQASARL